MGGNFCRCQFQFQNEAVADVVDVVVDVVVGVGLLDWIFPAIDFQLPVGDDGSDI